jgi:hypothetical protein
MLTLQVLSKLEYEDLVLVHLYLCVTTYAAMCECYRSCTGSINLVLLAVVYLQLCSYNRYSDM